ncbi:MAG: ABC transporter substrate-binding protein [Spirochaetes bacterium]|nr:ABC transporter substrate-binding protein [Spirochaetota bacterium]
MRFNNFLPVFLLLFCSCREEKIAFVGTLSGTASKTGLYAKNGLEIAVDEINTSGGIGGSRIVLDIFDDKNNPSIAEGIDYGIAMKSYKIIIGHNTSEMSKAGLKAIANKQILMISPYSASDGLSGLNDNFIRITPASRSQAETTARYAKQTGYKRIYVLYDKTNIAYSSTFIKYFSDETGNPSILYKTLFESADDKTLREILYQSSILKPDSFLILTSGRTLAVICQSLRKNGFRQQIFSSGAAANEELLENSGKHSEGIIFSHFINFNIDSEQSNVFREKYLSKFGEQPSIVSLLAYDSIMILKQSIEENKLDIADASIDEIKESIIRKKNFNLLTGSFSINLNGDAERKTYLYRISKGKYVLIGN